VPHIGRRAFEQAATAEREQRVGGKEQLVVGEVVADMAGGVAGGLDDADRVLAEQEGIRLPSTWSVW
jgi:hypothetical protein